MLNGLAHLDRLDARFGAASVMGGTCQINVALAPGRHRAAHGAAQPHPLRRARPVEVGARAGVRRRAREDRRIDWTWSEDILQDMWEKVVVPLRARGDDLPLPRQRGRDHGHRRRARPSPRAASRPTSRSRQAEGHAPRERVHQVGAPKRLTTPGPQSASMLRDMEARQARRGGPHRRPHALARAQARDRRHGPRHGLHPPQDLRSAPRREPVTVASDAGVNLWKRDGRGCPPMTREYDYVIVGAGSAGCVLANRLSAGRQVERPAAGGRRQGRLVLDRHPGRLPLHDRQPAHRLVLQDRARCRASTAASSATRAARCSAAARRSTPWSTCAARRRTTTTGPRSATRAGRWDDVLPLFKQHRGLLRGRERLPRRGRRAARGGAARALGDPRRLARGGGGVRHPEDRRVQPRRQLRQRLLPHEPEARACAGAPPRRGCARRSRGPTSRWSRRRTRRSSGSRRATAGAAPPASTTSSKGRASRHRHGAQGRDPRRRRHRLAADPAALGRRARRAAREARHPGRPRHGRASARTCTTTCRSAWSTR